MADLTIVELIGRSHDWWALPLEACDLGWTVCPDVKQEAMADTCLACNRAAQRS